MEFGKFKMKYKINKGRMSNDMENKENIENKEIDYDYDIEDIENNKETKDNINNVDKNKEEIYEGFDDNMNFDCSAITKKEESSEQTTNSELQINNLQINDINKKEMIYKCKSSSSSPYISKCNCNNVIDMSFMFYNCESLKFLPDLSNLQTNNVTNMRNMFSNCGKLLSFPDISNWKTQNVTDMS